MTGTDPEAAGEFDAVGWPCGWIRLGPVRDRPLVLLAHGAGAPMTSPFLAEVAEGLAARGSCVARFHFPYMERRVREGRMRPPDRAPILLEAFRAMVRETARWRGRGPLVLAGKSLGGRMASMLLAAGEASEARAAVYLGYPLHPAGRPGELRDAHLPAVPVSQLFVSGDRDPLCDLSLLRPVLARIGSEARLIVVPGADHTPPVRADWLDAVAAFVREAVS